MPVSRQQDEPGAIMAAEFITFEFITFLHCARQARLCALACPDLADTYKARARYWFAMAARATGPPLP